MRIKRLNESDISDIVIESKRREDEILSILSNMIDDFGAEVNTSVYTKSLSNLSSLSQIPPKLDLSQYKDGMHIYVYVEFSADDDEDTSDLLGYTDSNHSREIFADDEHIKFLSIFIIVLKKFKILYEFVEYEFQNGELILHLR